MNSLRPSCVFPAMVSSRHPAPAASMATLPRLRFLVCCVLLLCAPHAAASWQFTNGNTGSLNGFSFQASVTENPANTFTGTATLTAFEARGQTAF